MVRHSAVGVSLIFAGGAYVVMYACAHQQGGLNCSRVPHRPAGVLVAQSFASQKLCGSFPEQSKAADLQNKSALPTLRLS